jgi:hypothetical protein
LGQLAAWGTAAQQLDAGVCVVGKSMLLARVVPFLSTSVVWRGNRLRIGPRTLLMPASSRVARPVGAAGLQPSA